MAELLSAVAFLPFRWRGAALVYGAMAVLLLAAWSSEPVAAHESRPAFLEMTEVAPGKFDATWRRPARGDLILRLVPELPAHCQEGDKATYLAAGAQVERWQIDCGKEGLVDQPIRIAGLEETLTDTLVRVNWSGGTVFSEIVRGDDPQLTIRGEATPGGVIRDYFILGVEHILGGMDHLLFVLCLLMLVSGVGMLVKTITAFTVAHSITLAMAALGYVSMPQAPVEAVIALSILFLAVEIARDGRTGQGLAARAPWVVAFCFGLLHGFGFAGALSEIGLPPNEIPLALLMFNVGVEAGQLLFVALVFALLWIYRRVVAIAPDRLQPYAAYGIGALAAFWTIERVTAFWA